LTFAQCHRLTITHTKGYHGVVVAYAYVLQFCTHEMTKSQVLCSVLTYNACKDKSIQMIVATILT